jgi:aryl-alcohol dehydrogenase-like predicted oxidoreductase
MIEQCLRLVPVASDQPLYNMLQREAEEDLLPFCADNDVGVIVYSPLRQGLLTGKVPMDRTFPEDDQRSWRPWFQPQNRKRALDFLDRLRPIAQRYGKTLAQVAINWCLQQRGITAAIVGARSPEQVEQNAGGAGWAMSDEDLRTIRGWLEELGDPIEQ